MLDYGTFCYLQNQKTGCTFVETFLRRWCAEPLLSYHKHAPAGARVAGKFYFTNVREPLALYRSLYAYGLDGKGTVFLRLQRLGHGQLYQPQGGGFAAWLDFVLQPVNAPLLSDAYTPALARGLGFMSWRFLRLACAGFEQAAPTFATQDDLSRYVRQHYLLGAVLKQESLLDDLCALVQGRLAASFADPAAAVAWLAQAPRVNTSSSAVDATADSLDGALRQKLMHRENSLYRNFYPALGT